MGEFSFCDSLDTEERDKFFSYIANSFGEKKTEKSESPFVAKWQRWIKKSEDKGVEEVLNDFLLSKRPVHFMERDNVIMEIYRSFAGDVPMLIFGRDEDFEQFVVNAACRGETPSDIHQMGASFLFNSEVMLIALSRKPYSNVPAGEMGLAGDEWRRRSLLLRREHECTHLYTRLFYGTARNNLHDELMADFFGLMAAMGRYEARWFRRFMGIGMEGGGRLSLYTQGLPPKVKEAVSEAAGIASDFLERWSRSEKFSSMSRPEQVDYLCRLGIEGMCGEQ